MTHSRYKQYLKEVQTLHISLDWLCPISKTKLPICLRRFASGGFLLERPAFAILSPSPSFRLRHPFAFTILACLHHPPKRLIWWTNRPFLPSPSTKTAFLVDEPPFRLRHPPKRPFWWTNRPFAFTIHQNGLFGGWGMEGPPQKASTFRARIRFHGRIPSEAPGSGTAAMLSLRRVF